MTVKSRLRLWVAGVSIAFALVSIQASVDLASVVGQRQAITAANRDLAAVSRLDARVAGSDQVRLQPTDPGWAAWGTTAGPAEESVDRARTWLDRIDQVALAGGAAERMTDLRWYVRKASAELRAAAAISSNAMASSWEHLARGLLLGYIFLFAGATGVYLIQVVPTAGITVVTARTRSIRRKRVRQLPGMKLDHVRHELRTPLTVILGYAAELESQLEGELKEFATTIRKSGDRLHDTVEEILAYADLADEDTTLTAEPVEIHAVVESVIRKLRPLAFEKRLKFVYRATKAEAWVSANAEALETAVTHLVENALKYTDSGSVVVTVEAENERVRLAVEDTGVGFEEARLTDLSLPFRQASSGDARHHEGVGLGLTIARKVVEASGGRLTASSEPGVGSRFTITLPQHAVEMEARRAA
jgi:signal transduction histidine kinase